MDFLAPALGVIEFTFPFFESVPVLRAIIGLALVFFIPGFAWTLVFIGKISLVERAVFAIGLSIALVTLSILALNRFLGMSVTGTNSVLVILFITTVPIAIFYIRRYLERRRSKT